MHSQEKNLSMLQWRSSSFLFFSATRKYQFKTKDSEIKGYTLPLGHISKDFTTNNLKRTGLKGSVIFFSVDFDCIGTKHILDIKKKKTIWILYINCLGQLRKYFCIIN